VSNQEVDLYSWPFPSLIFALVKYICKLQYFLFGVCGGGNQGSNGIWPAAGCSTYESSQRAAAPGDATGDRAPLGGFELGYSLLKLLFCLKKTITVAKTITIMVVMMM
jgi:hypothetical protein